MNTLPTPKVSGKTCITESGSCFFRVFHSIYRIIDATATAYWETVSRISSSFLGRAASKLTRALVVHKFLWLTWQPLWHTWYWAATNPNEQPHAASSRLKMLWFWLPVNRLFWLNFCGSTKNSLWEAVWCHRATGLPEEARFILR